MNKKIYLTIALLCLTSASFAATDLTFSLGNLCEYVGEFQTDEKGDKNVCSFTPYIASSMDVSVADGFFVSPQLAFSLPQKGTDENIKRMTIAALINAKYKNPYVNVIGGLGLFFTRIWGPGGEVELNNGTTIDSFPLPEEAVYTRNFILNLGLEKDFTTSWSGEIRTYIFNIASSEDRALSVGVHATYHFGEIL